MNNEEQNAPLDPALVAHLEQELDALRELVRREVGARLSAVELAARPATGASGWRGLWRRRADWIAVLLLAGLLWNGWQLWTLRSAPAATAEVGRNASPVADAVTPADAALAAPGIIEHADRTSTGEDEAGAPESTAPERASAPPTGSVATPSILLDLSDPMAQWRSYLSENRARIPAWAASIASTPHEMSAAQRARFERYGAEPATTVATHAAEFLGGAFEVAMRDAVATPLPGAVDLAFRADEYSAARLREAAERLAVGALLTDPLTVDTLSVRVAIAVAHLERQATVE